MTESQWLIRERERARASMRIFNVYHVLFCYDAAAFTGVWEQDSQSALYTVFCDVSVFTGLYRQKSQGALCRVYSIIERCHIAVIVQYIVMLQCSPKCGGKTDKTRKVHCVLYCSVVYCDVAVFT